MRAIEPRRTMRLLNSSHLHEKSQHGVFNTIATAATAAGCAAGAVRTSIADGPGCTAREKGAGVHLVASNRVGAH